jgi:hypothetical protein
MVIHAVRIRSMHPPWCFLESLRLGRIGRFQNLKSSRPQPLSVCRTKDCIFFHDQDDRFFREGHRSTTRLKQEDPGTFF